MSNRDIFSVEQAVLRALDLPLDNPIINLDLMLVVGSCPIVEVDYYAEPKEKSGDGNTIKTKKYRFFEEWEEI